MSRSRDSARERAARDRYLARERERTATRQTPVTLPLVDPPTVGSVSLENVASGATPHDFVVAVLPDEPPGPAAAQLMLALRALHPRTVVLVTTRRELEGLEDA